MDFFFKTDITKLIYIPFLVVSVLITFYLYKKSKLTGYPKYILPVLRGLTVFLLLILFTSPVLSFLRTITEQPRNITLLDNSESLLLEDRYLESLQLLSEINSASTSGNKNEFYFFSGSLKEQLSSVPFDSSDFFVGDIYSTDIGNALMNVVNSGDAENIASIHLVTDGINTQGSNPSYLLAGYNIPVYLHLIGDTIQKKDLSITDIWYNKRAFIESRTPVRIRFNSFGNETGVRIKLFDGDNLLEEKFVNVSTSQSFYETEFFISSSHPGFRKFRVELEGLPGEITYRNNSETFFIKFIDNKFRVLVISGSPSSDLAFLRQEMKRISNFETSFLTQKGRGTYYESDFPDINRYQSVIFIGYPNKFTDDIFLSDIVTSIKRNNQSVFFFASQDTDFSKIQILEEVLPFVSGADGQGEFETTLRSVTSGNELFRNSDFLNTINSLPQIFVSQSTYSPKPGSETIVINNRTQEPALIVNTSGESGKAAFLAHGFYNWRLTPADHRVGESVLSGMISNVILSITDKDKQKSITVETDRPVYSPGENFMVKANVNPSSIETKGNVTLRVRSTDLQSETEMIQTGPSVFETSLLLNEKADYMLIAELHTTTGFVDSDTTMIEIGSSINEFRITKPSAVFPENIATATGGKLLTPEDNLSDYLGRKVDSQKTLVSNIALNFNFPLLLTVILLMCIEWFFRKRNNLP